MITTQGYGVGVMPQLSQPNPAALSGFNPQQVTGGALDALQISSTLDQIKAFRQHQEEFAKMEHARNAMLQAQSDQEVIKRDHANAIRQSKIDSDLAEFNFNAKTKPALADFTVKQAGSGSKDLDFIDTQRGLLENLTSLRNKALSDNISTEVSTVGQDSLAKLANAQLALQKANQLQASLSGDSSRKAEADIASIEKDKAQATYDRANAEFKLSQPEINKDKQDSRDRMAQEAHMIQFYNAAANEANNAARVLNDIATKTKVPDPNNLSGPLVPLSAVEDLLFDEDANGNKTLKTNIFGNPRFPIGSSTKAALQRYQDQSKRVSDLQAASARLLSQALEMQKNPSQPNFPSANSGTTKVYGQRPDGTFGEIK